MPSISGWSEKQHSKPSTAEAFNQPNPRDNGNNPASRSALGGWGTSTRRSARQSARRSTTSRAGGGDAERVRVLDEAGVDRTPKSLMTLNPAVTRQTRGGPADDAYSSASEDNFLDRISSARFSQVGGWASGQGSASRTPPSETDAAAAAAAGAARAEQAAGDTVNAAAAKLTEQLTARRSGPRAPLPEAELERYVYVTLTETETIFLLEVAGTSVNAESEDGRAVLEANQRYEAALIGRPANVGNFSTTEAQTLTGLKKSRDMQAGAAEQKAAGCQASRWDIDDAYAGAAATKADAAEQAAAVTVGPAQGMTAGPALALAAGGVAGGSVAGPGSSSSRRVSQAGWGSLGQGPSGRDLSSSANMGVSTNFASSSWGASLGGGGGANAAAAMAGAMADASVPVDPLAALSGLQETLELMDAVVQQNLYLPRLLEYRDVLVPPPAGVPDSLPPGAEEAAAAAAGGSGSDSNGSGSEAGDEDEAPRAVSQISLAAAAAAAAAEPTVKPPARMELLWHWQCDLTAGLTVNSVAWNKARPDLLAAGYGPAEHTSKGAGLVAFWSLKNPEYPLWAVPTASGIATLDFSTRNANILAVGMYDGTVALYDAKDKQATPVMEATAATGKHADPVWKVGWLDRGAEREEVLISISTDGRVSQWSTAKGLDCADIMKLKRVPRRQTPLGAVAATLAPGQLPPDHDPFISRLTSGMTFDFSRQDARIFLAGTEDGWIHKCSSSYVDAYVESFDGHTGPVYAVQWSPFSKGLFLSCSADWSMRLWQEGRPTPLLVFESSPCEVVDVQWSPSTSTMFAAATAQGKLELWDFSSSCIRPVAEHQSSVAAKLGCVSFATNSPVLVCGGDDGAIAVLRVYNGGDNPIDVPEQVSRMDAALEANVMKSAT